jgi:homoserine kinase type II
VRIVSCLAPALVDALRTRYRLELDAAEPLLGGYDVWAESWRLESSRGPLVLRADRLVSPETARWIADVVQHAAEAGAPCSAPLQALDGSFAFRGGGATMTLTRFIDGRAVDRNDPVQLKAAGATLGLLHRALAGKHARRPVPSQWEPRFWSADRDPPILRDDDLDDWHEAFTEQRAGTFAHGVVHGDFWAGNLIWADERVAGVIDWAEARVDALACELAWSTWEFGRDENSRQLDTDRGQGVPGRVSGREGTVGAGSC